MPGNPVIPLNSRVRSAGAAAAAAAAGLAIRMTFTKRRPQPDAARPYLFAQTVGERHSSQACALACALGSALGGALGSALPPLTLPPAASLPPLALNGLKHDGVEEADGIPNVSGDQYYVASNTSTSKSEYAWPPVPRSVIPKAVPGTRSTFC